MAGRGGVKPGWDIGWAGGGEDRVGWGDIGWAGGGYIGWAGVGYSWAGGGQVGSGVGAGVVYHCLKNGY